MPETLRLRSDDVEWRVVGDEVIALHLPSSTYLAVNAVGATVWPKLVEGGTREQLVAAVLERFDVDEATARRDLDAFLADLDERGLIAQ